MPRDPIASLLNNLNEHINKVYNHGLYPPDAVDHWSREIVNYINQIDRKLRYVPIDRKHIDRMTEKCDELSNLVENVVEPFISNPYTDSTRLNMVYERLKQALEKLKKILKHFT